MSNQFDEYADDYDSALERGITLSGEDKLFFARERVNWLRKCLEVLRATPKLILDVELEPLRRFCWKYPVSNL